MELLRGCVRSCSSSREVPGIEWKREMPVRVIRLRQFLFLCARWQMATSAWADCFNVYRNLSLRCHLRRDVHFVRS